ncbi:Ribonuclease/ribotoxin [Aspergillus floccosus]
MVSFSFILTLSLAVISALASPTPDDSAITGGQVYTCKRGANNDGALIGKVPQDKAIGYFHEAKTKSGKSGYPKRFTNNEKLKFQKGCRDKKVELWELPVLDGGRRYAYDKPKQDAPPGAMRVYYTKDLKFCGIGAKSKPDNSGPVHLCKV